MDNTPHTWQRLTTLATSLNSRTVGRLLCTLALAAGLALPAAQAQSATGTVTGRVLNVGNDKYVPNAVVTVEGTKLETLTNSFGEFHLPNVPAGEVQLKVVSGGLDTETATLTVPAGGTVNRDFNLTSAERYGDDKTVQLDTFVVSANREFEGNAIATNEQRYAKGLKVVMAADAFGDVTEGNVGEFLKFLPGVSVDYVAADVRTVSVRGFASNFTNVYFDGMPTTSSNSGAAGRQFEFEQASINNAARVEVLKVPTPDMPANGIGGNVNLVSKSSLERKGAQLNYRVYLSLNNEDLKLGKTPGPKSKSSNKVLPGFDFDYTLPVSKNFGLVITGINSMQFNEQHRWQTGWNFQQGGALLTNPRMSTGQLQDGPKFTDRQSASIKADWKLGDNQRLSVMVQDSYYHSFFGNRNLNFDVGTTATTAAVGGQVLQWGPGFSQAATGTFSATDPYGNRGRVTQGSSFRDKYGNTAAANARWTYSSPLVDIEAGAHAAKSRTWYRILGRGHFANVGTRMVGVSNLRVDGIEFPYHTFQATNATGGVISPYDLNNFRLTTLTDDPIDGVAEMKGGYVDATRDFEVGGIPLTAKAGVRVYQESKDNRRATRNWTYVGADGVANTADDSAAAYLDTNYSGEDPYWGSQPIQWINAYKLADTYASNPNYFTVNDVTSEQFRINNSEKITETITAGYVQLEGKLLNNRLTFITGVRYERTKDAGEGVLILGNDVLFEKNTDGSLRDGDPATPGLQYVRLAAAGPAGTAGATNSTATGLTQTQVPSGTLRTTAPYTFTNMTLQELALTSFERGSKPVRSYDDYYPSLNLTYSVTDNLQVRLGYAKTMGRPDYTNILPFTTIDDNENFDLDPTVSPGTLTTRNTGLKPWSADNFDLSVEYYFKNNGYVQVGVFHKEIADFFATRSGTVDAALAQQLGIGPEFIGWGVSTLINGAGTAKITGYEISVNRKLDFLPGYLRYLTVNANGTKLELSGPEATAFSQFIPKTANFSLSWNKKPVSARVSFNYRGNQLRSAQTGGQYNTTGGPNNGFYEYYKPRWTTDVNAEYTLSKRVTIFANARNILNEPQILQRYNAATPEYAVNYQQEEFGIQIAVGIKGRF
ncbi:MAG: TonB-dependent receptor [Lacunisphaera sp.]|nr:TonB-dependent receptor [Lacunisphaera sp.]